MYHTKTHIHFAGIGGIGMSAIATLLKVQGYTVSGCDLDLDQQSIVNLKTLGCTIYHGNNTPGCNDTSIDIMVYSTACKNNNAEITAALERGIPAVHRSIMLGELMRTKFSIAVTGSHGKTTTTSLISHMLMQALLDPTIIIGGHLSSIGNNARAGTGKFLVAEADESDRSFMNLYPTIALVTNIDLEHLETYRDIDDIKATFKDFIAKLPFYGTAVMCLDDEHIRSLLPTIHTKVITYGLDTTANVYATDIILNASSSTFTAWHNGTHLGTVTCAMPGKHNVLNALGALAVGLDIGIDFHTIARSLAHFQGIERRFTYRGEYKGAEIFDDYGHHPREIYHTLLVARKRTKSKLVVVFQPHRYTRTDKLWDDFVATFVESSIDHLIITDIFAASEDPIAGITSQKLVDAIAKHKPKFTITYAPYEQDFASIIQKLEVTVDNNDLVLLLGAGKVNKLTSYLPPHFGS
jgi:UDP-N-acetylmuramate--alanine ligase